LTGLYLGSTADLRVADDREGVVFRCVELVQLLRPESVIDCLIFAIDWLIFAVDCLICAFDWLICAFDWLICATDCLTRAIFTR